MTESEQDKAIRNLASALDRLQNDNFDLRCCLGATFAASALMIFLVVWFGGVNITIVNEPPRYPANVGELVKALETAPPETPLGKEKK
ncbi:MAG: hypothetical protein IKK39_02105 [Thermoguttaceae bacterium]|nr:hypothetical protein [Thermoguttaceae bacterium]MBR4102838.1 hypothetical protein [Thermoguttaceae bacterium]